MRRCLAKTPKPEQHKCELESEHKGAHQAHHQGTILTWKTPPKRTKPAK